MYFYVLLINLWYINSMEIENKLNTISKTRMGFYKVALKEANMRKAQEFTIYPSVSKFGEVWLQSDKRFVVINIKTGKGLITHQNKEYPTRMHLQICALEFTPDQELVNELIRHYEAHKLGTNKVQSGGTVLLTF